MISQTPIFDVLEQRVKEKDGALKANVVKVEVRSPVEKRTGIFCGSINFETRQKIASFTIWEREVIQVEVLMMDLESGKSKIVHDGVVSSCEKALKIFLTSFAIPYFKSQTRIPLIP